MNLIDFELHFRDEKIKNARLKYEVVELKKAKVRWTAKVTPGLYKPQIGLSGICIDHNSCNCSSRSRTGFCEHALAMLFVIRKELGIQPALPTTTRKLTRFTKQLTTTMRSLLNDENLLSRNGVKAYVEHCDAMLNEIPAALKKKDYETAACLTFDAYNGLFYVDEHLAAAYSPLTLWKVAKKCVDWIETLSTTEMPSQINDNIFHDLRIESVRRYFTWSKHLKRNPLDILLLAATTEDRKAQFLQTIDTLSAIEKADTEGGHRHNYKKDHTEELLAYRNKVVT